MNTELLPTAELNDAGLVAESLAGDREAFRQIVERYQTLISSLAYCATGNVCQSEDLAQETFVSAWKKLPDLREPAKLRPWLCSITRFLISKEFRRQGRQPSPAANLEAAVDEWVSPEPLPPDQAISHEEKTLLWRSLERMPGIYREPLVLFYREHQSIEAVAHGLDLSEDAVKQRLSRGRKLLQEEFLSLVAGALRQTAPGKTFTVAVLAALPLLATTAKAAGATAAAAKGGSAAKAATGAGMISAFLSGGMLVLFSLFGVFGFLGRWFGGKMGRASQQTALGRQCIVQFWRTLAAGFALFVFPSLLIPRSLYHSHPGFFQLGTWSLAAFYWLVAIALIIWAWQRRRDASRPPASPQETSPVTTRSYNGWIALGMAGPACIVGMFLFALFFSDWTISSKPIPASDARGIISERQDARFTVYQYRDGSRSLRITLPGNHRIDLSTPLDDTLISGLTAKGIAYPTLIEDQDFHNGGVRGWLVLLSTFIVVAGAVLLLRRPGTQKFREQKIIRPRGGRKLRKFATVCAALVMGAIGLLLALSAFTRSGRSITGAEAARIITGNQNARFDVFQYQNGSKVLWITPPESRTYPAFTTPADASTLTLLAENKISPQTYIQGRDFGYRGPGKSLLLTCSFGLTAGAIIVFRHLNKENGVHPTVAVSTV